jgi:hypothetical protein
MENQLFADLCSKKYLWVYIKYVFSDVRLAAINILFFGIFCVGIGELFYGFHLKRKLVLAADAWPVSKGIITHSELGSMSSNNSSPGYRTTYYPIIEFEFSVDNTKYVSKKVRWGGHVEANSQGIVASFIEPYPVGKTVDVHYNPQNPADCVIETDPSFVTKLPIMIGIAFIIGGGLFAWATLFAMHQDIIDLKLWPK